MDVESAAAGLGKPLSTTRLDDFREPRVLECGGYVPDVRMQVLVIIPLEEPGEVIDGVDQPFEPLGVLGMVLDRAEAGLDEGVVVGRPGPAEKLGDPEVREELLEETRLHGGAPIVEDDGEPGVGGQKPFGLKGAVGEDLGELVGLAFGDEPGDDLSAPLVEHDVEEEEGVLDEGSQVRDIPAPALIGSGEFLARGLSAGPTETSGATAFGNQALLVEDP